MNKSQELREEAFQYALGTLPASEHEAFERRLKTDRELQNQVHEWQRVNEEDALDCEQIEPPFQSYASIMSEIDGEASSHSTAGSPLASFYSWGGWAAAACLAVLFGLTIAGPLEDRTEVTTSDIVLKDLSNPEAVASIPADQEEEVFQDRLLELTGLAEAYWFSREGLPPATPQEGVDAQAFTGGFSIYDNKIKIGVIGIENIPEGRLGTYYNVWAQVSEGGDPVWAGMLEPGEAGSRLAFFDLSSNADIQEENQGISFFVTEENETHPERPEGPVVLSGI